MKSTTTYLHFNGNCRTAMAFYRDCFGGESTSWPIPMHPAIRTRIQMRV